MNTRQIVHSLAEQPTRLFLIDSLGACLTVFMLLAVLVPFEQHIGMPPPILRGLAVPAILLALYSACGFWFAGSRWRVLMRLLAVGNGLYCCVTVGLIINYFDQLAVLGVAYFALEVVVILVLLFVEYRAAT